jgi:exosortase/archaeosortase family protein
MNSKLHTKMTASNLWLAAILSLTAAYSLFDSLRMHQGVESVITLWLLAAGMSALTIWNLEKKKTAVARHDIILSWVFLICANGALLTTAYINDSLAMQISIFLIMGACLARFTSYQNVLKLLPAGAIFLILLPNSTYFNSLISYPLRLICSYLTCWTLNICAVDISCSGTILQLGAEKIAVTTACSGIAQLEAMFFIGWIIAVIVQKRLICQILHWLLLFPIVILLNSLRLTITLLLYLGIGEAAFSETLHITLGYVMVIAVVTVFWACRSLIRGPEKNEDGK